MGSSSESKAGVAPGNSACHAESQQDFLHNAIARDSSSRIAAQDTTSHVESQRTDGELNKIVDNEISSPKESLNSTLHGPKVQAEASVKDGDCDLELKPEVGTSEVLFLPPADTGTVSLSTHKERLMPSEQVPPPQRKQTNELSKAELKQSDETLTSEEAYTCTSPTEVDSGTGISGLPGRGVLSPKHATAAFRTSSQIRDLVEREKLVRTTESPAASPVKSEESHGIFDDAEDDCTLPYVAALQANEGAALVDTTYAGTGVSSHARADQIATASQAVLSTIPGAATGSQFWEFSPIAAHLPTDVVPHTRFFSASSISAAYQANDLVQSVHSGLQQNDPRSAFSAGTQSSVPQQNFLSQSFMPSFSGPQLLQRSDSQNPMERDIVINFPAPAATLQLSELSDSALPGPTAPQPVKTLLHLAPRDYEGREYESKADIHESSSALELNADSHRTCLTASDTEPLQPSTDLERLAPQEQGKHDTGGDMKETGNSEKTDENKKRKRPKVKKRRVLPKPEITTSLKERRFTEETLSGRSDLLSILPSEDCCFLGEKFWIFTVQQLEYVLLKDGKTNDAFNEHIPVEAVENNTLIIGELRSDLVREVAKSALVTGAKDDLRPLIETPSNVTLPGDGMAANSTEMSVGLASAGGGDNSSPAVKPVGAETDGPRPLNRSASDVTSLDDCTDKDSVEPVVVLPSVGECRGSVESILAEKEDRIPSSRLMDKETLDSNSRDALSATEIDGGSTEGPMELMAAEGGNGRYSALVPAMKDNPARLDTVTPNPTLSLDKYSSEKLVAIPPAGDGAGHSEAVESVPAVENDKNLGSRPINTSTPTAVLSRDGTDDHSTENPVVSSSSGGGDEHSPADEPVTSATDYSEPIGTVARTDNVALSGGGVEKNLSTEAPVTLPSDGDSESIDDRNPISKPDIPSVVSSWDGVDKNITKNPTVTTNVNDVDGSAQSTNVALTDQCTDGMLEKAELRLKTWENALLEWRDKTKEGCGRSEQGLHSKESVSNPLETLFPLHGPVSCLFPPLFLNFLSSMSVDTSFKFLSARKTELSGLIYAFQLWRVACGMPPLKAIALARCMLGLTARLKTAVTSIPPADDYTRTWMGCELAVLTGSAKDVLIDVCHFESGSDLVNSKTKDVSDRLVAWRELKSLPPLKGSGKVAMVSGWKALVRETIEAMEGEGKVMPREEFIRDGISLFPVDSENSPQEDDPDTAMKSPTFLSEVLEADDVAFLDTQGITSAEKLLEHRERPASPFVKALLEFKKEDVSGSDCKDVCITLLGFWIDSVEDALKQRSQQKKKGKKKRRKGDGIADSQSPASKKGSTKKGKKKRRKGDGAADSQSPASEEGPAKKRKKKKRRKDGGIADSQNSASENCKAGVTLPVAQDKKKENENVVVGSVSEACTEQIDQKTSDALNGGEKIKGNAHLQEEETLGKGRSLPSSHNVEVAKTKSQDPIHALSVTARRFLETQGIASGEQLLSSKTSLVAQAFVDWRERQNMVALKGQGSIATVSGWKGTIRKAAGRCRREAMGKSPTGSQTKGNRKGILKNEQASRKKSASSEVASMQVRPMVHRDVLLGFPSREITVSNHKGDLFDFELTVRRPGEDVHAVSFPPGIGVYITYNGWRRRDSSEQGPSIESQTVAWKEISRCGIRSFPILADAPRGPRGNGGLFSDFLPFSSHLPCCGLIDLGLYGVQAGSSSDRTDRIKRDIKEFVFCDNFSTESINISPPTTKNKGTGSTESAAVDTRRCSGVQDSVKELWVDKGTAIDNSPIPRCSANVFPVNARSGMQYLLYLAQPMEKGQTTELRIHPQTQIDISPTTSRVERGPHVRIALDKELSMLTLDELNSIQNFVLESVAKSPIAEFAEVVQSSAEMADDLGQNEQDNLKLLVSRRRLHWVVGKIKEKIDACTGLLRNPRSSMSMKAESPDSTVDDFIWNTDLSSSLNLIPQSFDMVRDEVSNEIVAALTQKSSLKRPYDIKVWCPISSMLLKRCIELVSTYVLGNDSNLWERQQALRSALQLSVSDTVEALLAPDINLGDFAFSISSRSNGNRNISSEVLDDSDQLETLIEPSELLPEEPFVLLSKVQAYADAINLCDEYPWAVEELAEVDKSLPSNSLVVTSAPWSVTPKVRANSKQSRLADVVMRDAAEVAAGNASLHIRWYIEHQILSVVHAVASCGVVAWEALRSSSRQPTYIYNRDYLVSAVNDVLKSHKMEPIELTLNDSPGLGVLETATLEALVSTSPPVAMPLSPGSLQLFLGIVWPRLHSVYGWQLGAGDHPDDILFFPPGRKSRDRMTSGLKAVELQKERKRKGAQQVDQIHSLGLGHLTKGMKCASANSIEYALKDEEVIEDSGYVPTNPAVVITDALEHFSQVVTRNLSPGRSDVDITRVQNIAKGILTCFDDLAPRLLFPVEKLDDERNSESLGCEHLMRLLLLLPGLLKECGIPAEQLNDTAAVIQELTQFFDSRRDRFFDASFQPPPEEYPEDKQGKQGGFIASRIDNRSTESQGNLSSLSREDTMADGDELVRPEDRLQQTDYTVLAMSQMLCCRATQADVFKRGRRTIRVGSAGLVCRHCMGEGGEGKYFFSSLDSFGTALSVVFNHMSKCPKCPATVKQHLHETKAVHAEQRKSIKFGAQTEFFARIWAQLTGSKGLGSRETSPVPPPVRPVVAHTKPTPALGQDDGPREFHSHVSLISYLVNTPCWVEREDVLESIQLYYRCLEEGGRIYNTSAMPSHFNSEWLLAKMVPRQAHAKSQFLNVG